MVHLDAAPETVMVPGRRDDVSGPAPIDATGHLAAVQRVLDLALRRDRDLLGSACRHLFDAGGKRVRPLVTVLAASAVGQPDARTHAAAAAAELLHLSTLYHDDVIDDADHRRGVVAAHRAWGARLAVVAGNRLTALALETAARAGAAEATLIAATYARLVEGERRETLLVGCLDQSVDDYLDVIDHKTGALVAAAALAGVVGTAASAAHRAALEAWGQRVGRAYQVADDVVDLTSTAMAAGKPVAHDVEVGVFTLPLLDALQGPDGPRLRDLLAGEPPYPRDVVTDVVALVRDSGALARAHEVVHGLLADADRHLDVLPPGAAVDALRTLGRTLVPQDVFAADPARRAPGGGG